MTIIDSTITFLSEQYGKIATSLFVCILLQHNYRYFNKCQRLLALKKVQDDKLAKLKQIADTRTKEHLCDVLFFSGRAGACADHVIEKYDCPLPSCPASKIRKMESYIDNATTSLDICMYLITNKTLGDAILRAHKRGVTLRIISDGDMAFASGSQMVRFVKRNIHIYLTGPPYIMHEKFIVIDSTLVMQGSMNYTTQACSGNYEHVVITGTPGIVSAFRGHFDTLYNKLREEKKLLVLKSEEMSEMEEWG